MGYMVKNYSNTNNIKNEKINLKKPNNIRPLYEPTLGGSDTSSSSESSSDEEAVINKFSSLQQGRDFNKNKKKLKTKEGFSSLKKSNRIKLKDSNKVKSRYEPKLGSDSSSSESSSDEEELI